MTDAAQADDAQAGEAQIDELWPDASVGITDDAILSALGSPFAPLVTVNFVSSLDGAATAEGLSGALGSAADKRMFDLLRRPASAILVGAGTVRAEGYGPMVLDEESVSWRVGAGLAPHPVFAIVSGRLDLDPESRIFSAAPVRPIVLTVGSAPAAARDALERVADVIVAGEDELDVTAAITALRSRGLLRIHCEGGPSLFGSLLVADAVDQLSLTLSPQLVGGDAGRIVTADLPEARGLALIGAYRAADVLLLRYGRAS